LLSAALSLFVLEAWSKEPPRVSPRETNLPGRPRIKEGWYRQAIGIVNRLQVRTGLRIDKLLTLNPLVLIKLPC